MEVFTSIKTEVYVSSAWLDISADVLKTPTPKVSGIGIMGNSIIDRTGDPGTYTFSLKNGLSDIGGVLGYYTPGGANVLSGWTTGIPVRLSISYDGYKKMFYFTIDSDGIEVIPGKYDVRRVNVRCSNWLDRAAKHRLSLLGYQTSVRGDQGIQCVLDNMTFKPQSVALSQGETTYPTMFDITRSNTMAIGEISKIVMSDLSYAFVTGNDTNGETFRFMTRTDFLNKDTKNYPAKNSDFTDAILNETGGTDDILTEDGGRLLLEHAYTSIFTAAADQDNMNGLKVLYGKNLANHVKLITYPRKVDTSDVVLWSLETPITIAAGETLDNITGTYTDPNFSSAKISGISMVAPVATTDYQMWTNTDGLTGVDHTADLTVVAEYGTSEVKYSLTNNGAATYYIGRLQARGRGVYIYDPAEKLYDSTTSQATYGVMPLDIQMPYLDGLDNLFLAIDDKTATSAYNGGILTQLDDSMMTVEQLTYLVNRSPQLMLAFIFLDPSDCVKIYETITYDGNTGFSYWNTSWWIMGYDFEIISGKFIKWSMILKYKGLT